jgi:hypothetical protein
MYLLQCASVQARKSMAYRFATTRTKW